MDVAARLSPWGAYSSVFWMPIWLFDTLGLPAFSPGVLAALQAMWKTALFLSAIGLFTRPAMAVAFVLGVYLMGLPHNFGQTQHFDTLVVFASGALALSRAADAWSLDALMASLRQRRPVQPPPADGEYTWPIRFVWVAMALIFCAAGISKLRHSGLDWIMSDVFWVPWDRVLYNTRAYVSQRAGRGVGIGTGRGAPSAAGGAADVDLAPGH